MKYSTLIYGLAFTLFTISGHSADSPAMTALRNLGPHSQLVRDDIFRIDTNDDPKTYANQEAVSCSIKDQLEVWKITELSGLSVTKRLCGTDHFIRLQLYPRNEGGYLAAVVSIDGNHGQSQQFEFFWVDKSLRLIKPVSEHALGLTEVTGNDFIDSQKFNKKDNPVALRAIDDDGTIHLYPWTWMESAWEHREPTKEIFFSWNGNKFKRHVVKKR